MLKILIIFYIIGFIISVIGMSIIFKKELTKDIFNKILIWSLLSWLFIIAALLAYYFDLDDFDDNPSLN